MKAKKPENGQEMNVTADRERTRQVLFNLLGNALKYTQEGGVHVKVSYEGLGVKCRVYDTGGGIKEEDRGMLFEKFKQFGERVYRKDEQKGTGMGLYISRLIMEAMDGKVYLESSEVGKGSVFVFELPKG